MIPPFATSAKDGALSFLGLNGRVASRTSLSRVSKAKYGPPANDPALANERPGQGTRIYFPTQANGGLEWATPLGFELDGGGDGWIGAAFFSGLNVSGQLVAEG